MLLGAAFPPPMHGIARYAQDMMQQQLAQWHDLTAFPDQIPFNWRPRAPTAEATWNIVGRDGFIPTLRVGWYAMRRMWNLDRMLASGRFDVLHVLSTAGFGFFRNAAHLRIARRHRVRAVFHILGQFDDMIRRAGPRLRRVIRMSLDVADVHIVQSPGLAAFLREHTRRPVYSIFNGVQVDRLAPPGGFSHSAGGRLRVIALGVLGHKKGTYDLLDAAERLKDRQSNADFLFVGAGEVDLFRRLAAEKGLAGRTEFTGSVDDTTRLRLLHTSDIFALPSRAEGQPLALLEAMAAGLPVISSAIGSIPEVVLAQNGFVVAAGDVDGLVTRLDLLLSDGALRERMARFNAEEASTKYRLSRVMEEIDAVYAELGS